MAMPAPCPALQLQWALDDTVGSTITLAQGLLHAATSDNVQVVALRACESFGMTLPICLLTKMTIETEARPPTTSHVVKFLKARIGYAEGDSTEYLSRNEGGIRFLALAAALCTLQSTFEAARVVDALLAETAVRDQKRPTLRQLKDLLEALKVKIARSSFANYVVGWEDYYASLVAPGKFTVGQSMAPPWESIVKLVRALSVSSRLGKQSYVQIRCPQEYIPWSMALIKWLTGALPTIQTSYSKQNDLTQLIHPSPGSRVFIRERGKTNPFPGRYSVVIEEQIKTLQELISEGTARAESAEGSHCMSQGKLYDGLLTAERWARLRFLELCQRINFVNGEFLATMLVSLVQHLLDEIEIHPDVRNKGTPERSIDPRLRKPSPFPPSDRVIAFVKTCQTSVEV